MRRCRRICDSENTSQLVSANNARKQPLCALQRATLGGTKLSLRKIIFNDTCRKLEGLTVKNFSLSALKKKTTRYTIYLN